MNKENAMNINNAFPSPIITFYNHDLAPKLKEYILSLEVKGIESNVAPFIKHNLNESKFDFFSHDNKVIKETVMFIASCLKRTINELKEEEKDYNVTFRDSWFHVGRKNSSHDVHSHQNCSWCGIYYIDVGSPNSGGHTCFLSPIHSNFQDYATLHMNQKAHVIVPEDGKLVLFPSYLNHFQSLYLGEKERIVTAFNTVILPK